jgi:polyhydroxyalkanoate synthesis regulator phasin
MDMVNNIEPLYNEKMAMFDEWVEQGDLLSKREAREQAREIAKHFANAIGEKYGRSDIEQAVSEMMEEFEEHRDYVIKKAVERETHVPTPAELNMTPEDIEYAKKCEAIAQRIGIDILRELIPASSDKIRKALDRGDKHLNTIPLRKWDQAAAMIPYLPGKGLSLSEKVCALKHVAIWHYA